MPDFFKKFDGAYTRINPPDKPLGAGGLTYWPAPGPPAPVPTLTSATAIWNDLAYTHVLVNAQAIWNVDAQIKVAHNPASWNINVTVSGISAQAIWNVEQAVLITRQASWNVDAVVSGISHQAIWNVNAVVSGISRQAIWNVGILPSIWYLGGAGVYSGANPAGNGQTVTQWNDEGGGGFNLTTIEGFTYLTNFVNGQPAVASPIGSSGGELSNGSTAVNEPWTLFLVYRNHPAGNTWIDYLLASYLSFGPGYPVIQYANANQTWTIISGGGSGTFAAAFNANDTWVIMTIIWDGSSSSMRGNGSGLSVGGATLGTGDNVDGLWIGLGGGTTGSNISYLAEWRLFSSALTLASIQNIEQGLSTKYGIPI